MSLNQFAYNRDSFELTSSIPAYKPFYFFTDVCWQLPYRTSFHESLKETSSLLLYQKFDWAYSILAFLCFEQGEMHVNDFLISLLQTFYMGSICLYFIRDFISLFCLLFHRNIIDTYPSLFLTAVSLLLISSIGDDYRLNFVVQCPAQHWCIQVTFNKPGDIDSLLYSFIGFEFS